MAKDKFKELSKEMMKQARYNTRDDSLVDWIKALDRNIRKEAKSEILKLIDDRIGEIEEEHKPYCTYQLHGEKCKCEDGEAIRELKILKQKIQND